MKLDRKNVRTILLIIAFAVLLYTAAQNLASVARSGRCGGSSAWS